MGSFGQVSNPLQVEFSEVETNEAAFVENGPSEDSRDLERGPQPTDGEVQDNGISVVDSTTPSKLEGNSRYYYRNMAIFCLSFFLIFGAFQPLQNLQSSLNASLGFASLTVTYVFFIASTVFSPFLIKVFGAKYVIVVTYAAHCFYMISNYYPEYYTLIPGSIALGLASGPLWSSAAVYITSQADGVASVLGKDSSKYISAFTGVFFLTFFASSLVGNGVSSAVLLPDAGGLHLNLSNSADDSEVACSLDGQAETSPWAFYLLMSLFLVADIAALLLALFGLSTTRKRAFTTISCRRIATDFKETFTGFIKALFTQRYLLAAPLVAYQGFNMGMLLGIFSKHYITECVGIGFVGISQMIWGISSSLASFLVGKVIGKIPRSFVIVCGCVGDMAFLVCLLVWERVPSLPAIFLIVLFWGVGDGIWNTVPTSYIGIVTKKEKQDIAFSLQRFWMSIGFSVNFFISEQISVPVNLTIMVCFLLIAVFLFVVGDEVETRATYKFFKRLCCSRGVYWLDENVQVNSSNTTPFPVTPLTGVPSLVSTNRRESQIIQSVNPFFVDRRDSEVSQVVLSVLEDGTATPPADPGDPVLSQTIPSETKVSIVSSMSTPESLQSGVSCSNKETLV